MSLFETGADNQLSLADILCVEDTDDLMEFLCPATGIAIWPQVRMWFIRQVMGDLLYADAAPDFQMRHPILRASTGLFRSALHNRRLRHSRAVQSDVLLTAEAAADQLIEGKWFNRMADVFASVRAQQSMVLVDQHEWEWRFPRYNPRTYLHAPLQARIGIAAKLSVTANFRNQARQIAALIRERANSLIAWEMGPRRQHAFENYITRKIAGTATRYSTYRELFHTVRPRVLVCSSASYGQISPMLAAANDKGILTAELQHGAISEGHDAYNFAPAIRTAARFRRGLPKYFLSYGEWWNRRINAPLEKLAIGYPAREAKLATLPEYRGERNSVLILGDGVELNQYIALARRVRAEVAPEGLRVIFRPHPAERSVALARFRENSFGIEIDDGYDIYQAFQQAHTVVSEVSTGLFEAIGLVPRIVMLETSKSRFAYPVHPFSLANSIEALINVIVGKEYGQPNLEPDAVWAANWQANYVTFLAEKAGLEA